MDENRCREKHMRVDEILKEHNIEIEKLRKDFTIIEKEIVMQKKDTIFLQDAVMALKVSIDILIRDINAMKLKPLSKYEAISMYVITAVIGAMIGKVFL